MRSIYCIFSVAIGYATCANGVDFPSSGGNLASADDWGGAVPLNQDVAFRNSGTYESTADVTFAAISLFAQTAVFNLGGGGGAAHSVSCSQFSFEEGSLNTTLSGGSWTSYGVFDVGSTNATVKARNNTLTLTNGVSVSAVNTYVSNKQTGNTLKVCDNSTLSLSGNLVMGVNANGNNRIEILSGGTVSVGGNFQDGSFSAAKYKTTSSTANSVLVGGSGSRLSVDSYMTIGSVYCDNSVVVTNGAALENGNRIYVGAAATATNSSLSVVGGASVSGEDLMVGGGNATGSVFRVAGGSTATFTKDAYLGGYNTPGVDSRLEIENSDFTCRQLIIGRSSGIASTFRMSGANSSLTITRKNISQYPLFESGSGHQFILDGASWHHSDINLRLDNSASDSAVRLLNGASFVSDGGLYSGTNATASSGNTFYIGDGSCFTGQFMRISRRDNSVVVSNGCCSLVSQANSRNTGLRIGDNIEVVSDDDIGGNRLVLQGRAPKIRSAKEVRIAKGSALLFEIPEDGLDAENVPIVCSNLVVDASSSIRASGVDAFRKALTGSTVVYTLVEASDENLISIPAAVLADANDDLAEQGCARCAFFVPDDKRRLCLRVRPANSGMKVIFR